MSSTNNYSNYTTCPNCSNWGNPCIECAERVHYGKRGPGYNNKGYRELIFYANSTPRQIEYHDNAHNWCINNNFVPIINLVGQWPFRYSNLAHTELERLQTEQTTIQALLIGVSELDPIYHALVNYLTTNTNRIQIYQYLSDQSDSFQLKETLSDQHIEDDNDSTSLSHLSPLEEVDEYGYEN